MIMFHCSPVSISLELMWCEELWVRPFILNVQIYAIHIIIAVCGFFFTSAAGCSEEACQLLLETVSPSITSYPTSFPDCVLVPVPRCMRNDACGVSKFSKVEGSSPMGGYLALNQATTYYWGVQCTVSLFQS